MTERRTDKKSKMTPSQLYEAQTEVHNIVTEIEQKPPLLQVINEEILKQELKLAHLRDLQATYLKLSFDVVEATRQQLNAIIVD
jgi:predicted transcriptional regulator